MTRPNRTKGASARPAAAGQAAERTPPPALGAGADADRDRLALALSVGGLGSWTWDRATDRVSWDARLVEMLGRSPETVGAWLQLVHPDDRSQVAAALADAARSPEVARLDFRLVRPDGRVRWLECSGRALFDDGELVGAIGVMGDVTERHDSEDRTRALLQRVQLNADLSMTLAATLDLDVILRRLADRLVPDLADLCAVDLREGLPSRRLVAVAARNPEARRDLEAIEHRLPRRHNPASSLARTLADGTPTLVADCGEDYIEAVASDAELATLYRRLRMRSLLSAPLIARGQVLGAISFIRIAPYTSAPYGPEDVEIAMEICRRAALAVDNARLYTGERAIAEALQRALLPAIEAPPGIAVAARYLPAAAGVGGDWYDLFELPDGGTSITIGDVVGHDLRAAASMGQLRSVIRSYASEGADPAEVLDRADRLVQTFSMAQLATAFCARLRRVGTGRAGGDAGAGSEGGDAGVGSEGGDAGVGWLLSYANAGHPPPLVHRPNGSVGLLEGATGPPIGAPHRAERPRATLALPAGSTLVCYTDGLVERRERDLEVGLRRMADLVGAGRWRAEGDTPAARLERLCELLTDELIEVDRSDDVALLALVLD